MITINETFEIVPSADRDLDALLDTANNFGEAQDKAYKTLMMFLSTKQFDYSSVKESFKIVDENGKTLKKGKKHSGASHQITKLSMDGVKATGIIYYEFI